MFGDKLYFVCLLTKLLTNISQLAKLKRSASGHSVSVVFPAIEVESLPMSSQECIFSILIGMIN